MPSFADSAVIFILALMLFGPKKLPQLARQLGKLMAEFRRASNEFRMQMEDELRIEEQKEHQKKVDAIAGPPSTLPEPEHPHLPSTTAEADLVPTGSESAEAIQPGSAPEPIAESGDLRMMPPSTGLPTERGSYSASSDHHEFEFHDTLGSMESNGNHAAAAPAVGMSSEEPLSEAGRTEEQTHA